jgi:WD40 repeat protein
MQRSIALTCGFSFAYVLGFACSCVVLCVSCSRKAVKCMALELRARPHPKVVSVEQLLAAPQLVSLGGAPASLIATLENRVRVHLSRLHDPVIEEMCKPNALPFTFAFSVPTLHGNGGVTALTYLPPSAAATRIAAAKASASSATSVSAPADGRLVTAGADGGLQVWGLEPSSTSDPRNPICVVTPAHGHPIRALTTLPDGRFVSGDASGEVRMWAVAATSVTPVADYKVQTPSHLITLC